MDRAALLITGTVGVGKTTVAAALADLFVRNSVPHGVLDLDWLRRAWPSPEEDPFHTGLELRNLACVAANFRAAGVQRLVLAGVVESRADRDRYARVLGGDLTVCRLVAEPEVVSKRLRSRHERDGDDEALRWHLRRHPELDTILDLAAVEDFSVHIGSDTPARIAVRVAERAGWRL